MRPEKAYIAQWQQPVSIHAPVKDATEALGEHDNIALFQSTHP